MLAAVVVLYLFFSNLGVAQDDFFGKTKREIENFAKNEEFEFFSQSFQVDPDSTRFFLFKNGLHEPFVVTENMTDQINPSLESFFIIHGWLANGRSYWVRELAKRLHQVGQFNVISVDWSDLAHGDYFRAVKSIAGVGHRIKDFIKSKNIPINATQIIAHSLGGQLASYVANYLGEEKLKQIVGLDPAGPLFDWPVIQPAEQRLSPEDASTVQVIHTSKFVRGVTIACGTIDFYVNDAANQPGCPILNRGNNAHIHVLNYNLSLASCSHSLSHTYYILTVTDKTRYLGRKLHRITFFRYKLDTAYMGYGFDRKKYGVYKVKANETGVNPSTDF